MPGQYNAVRGAQGAQDAWSRCRPQPHVLDRLRHTIQVWQQQARGDGGTPTVMIIGTSRGHWLGAGPPATHRLHSDDSGEEHQCPLADDLRRDTPLRADCPHYCSAIAVWSMDHPEQPWKVPALVARVSHGVQ